MPLACREPLEHPVLQPANAKSPAPPPAKTNSLLVRATAPPPDCRLFLKLDQNDRIRDLRASEVKLLLCNKAKVNNADFTSIFKVASGWGMVVSDKVRPALLNVTGLTIVPSTVWYTYVVPEVPNEL